MKKKIGIISIVMGFMMAVMWTFFLVTGQVPELLTKPYAIAFHLAAEFVTAIMMILGGFSLLREKPGAEKPAILGFGFYMYAVIQAAGYFLQQGTIIAVVMFGVFFLMGLVFIKELLKTN